MRIAGNSDMGHTHGGLNLRRCGWLALLAFVALMLGAGCTRVREVSEPNAEVAYQKGMKEFEEKDYNDAIPFFQSVIENFPFSIHAVTAELKIAECYFYDEKYVEALVHLQGFEELHPTNDQIPYVLWMKAESYYDQFTSIDRDATPLTNARRELEELKSRFPGSAYEEKAEPLMRKILWRLAQHDFYVARFYYRDADYQATLARLYGILDEYRGEGISARAMYYVGKCHFFLQDNEAAKAVFENLIETHPDSPYARHSRMFVQDIEKGRFTVVSKFFRFNERVFGYFGYE